MENTIFMGALHLGGQWEALADTVGGAAGHHGRRWRTPWEALADTMGGAGGHHGRRWRTPWEALVDTMGGLGGHHGRPRWTPWEADSEGGVLRKPRLRGAVDSLVVWPFSCALGCRGAARKLRKNATGTAKGGVDRQVPEGLVIDGGCQRWRRWRGEEGELWVMQGVMLGVMSGVILR